MKVEFFSRGPVEQVSGGFHFNRRIIDFLRQRGVAVHYHPDKSGLDAIEAGDIVVVDSIVVSDYFDKLLALPVAPVLLLHMLPQRAGLEQLLRRSRIIGSGAGIRESLQQLAARDQFDITIIEPGVAFDCTYKRQYGEQARRLLYLANYLPGKGHLRTLAILAGLRQLDWTMDMHGNQTLAPGFADGVRKAVDDYGLTGRVTVADAIQPADVLSCMQRFDLLINLSEYETYSMVNAEAIACGLPVLSTRNGNWRRFAESGLVRLVDDEDNESACADIRALIENAKQYGQLRPAPGWKNRSWDVVCEEVLTCLQECA